MMPSKEQIYQLEGPRPSTLNLLFCAHTLRMNYETNTFLLVSSSVRSKQLFCFVLSQGQNRRQKHTTDNFVGFHNHSPLLTIILALNFYFSFKYLNLLSTPIGLKTCSS